MKYLGVHIEATHTSKIELYFLSAIIIRCRHSIPNALPIIRRQKQQRFHRKPKNPVFLTCLGS